MCVFRSDLGETRIILLGSYHPMYDMKSAMRSGTFRFCSGIVLKDQLVFSLHGKLGTTESSAGQSQYHTDVGGLVEDW